MPASSHARLGEPPADSSHLKKSVVGNTSNSKVSVLPYTVYESTEGTTNIKEYVNSDGVVFAITWRGGKHPLSADWLGRYYDEYKSQMQTTVKSAGRKPVSIDTPLLQIKHGGHMRDLNGKAFLPSAAPYGINEDDLQ